MKKSALRDFMERLFPSPNEQKSRTSELVERGLEALRRARNERSFGMGNVTRVPSRLELRLSQDRFDELSEVGAARDLSYFFTDEMMKDLAAEDMRTFGDHAVRITIAVDSSLLPHELYAIVMAPDTVSPRGASAATGAGTPSPAPVSDSTRALGQEEPAGTGGESPTQAIPSAPPPVVFRITGAGPDGFTIDRQIEGLLWIIGRRGSPEPLPEGYRKFELDNVRQSVSRHQAQLELEDERIRIRRIGKAPMTAGRDRNLNENEETTIEFGIPFMIEDYQLAITKIT